jgi:hypothetical protein
VPAHDLDAAASVRDRRGAIEGLGVQPSPGLVEVAALFSFA